MTQTSNTKRRVMRWALIVSLGINLVVIGTAIGVVTRFGAHFDRPSPVGPASLYVRALSHDSRRALGREMRQGGSDGGARDHKHNREIFQQGYIAVIEILRAPTLDQDALRRVLSDQAQFSQQRLDRARGALVQHIGSMTQADRRAYADTLEVMINRRD